MPEDRDRHDVLARITDTPALARVVPLLQPEILHAVITRYGLQDCGELLALTTPQQLSAVFDIDLWKAGQAGADEQFDAGRFCEWLEVLADVDPALAASRLAALDHALVVAGLSPSISVFDPASFEPTAEVNSAEPLSDPGRARDLHAEIGGYLIVGRHPNTWDVVVSVLLALEEQYRATFERVMGSCRALSNSGRELDGLDDLLADGDQLRHELSVARDQRRDRRGFLTPSQARAFLQSARNVSLTNTPPEEDQVFAGYRRAFVPSGETEERPAAEAAESHVDDSRARTSNAATVIELLRGDGLKVDAPRGLLPGAHDQPSPLNAALNEYLQVGAGSDDARWLARNEELAFLANALVAGCSIVGRSFTHREASDAVAATCNLGLECWPGGWPPATSGGLVEIFRVGWSVLHREVSMTAAARLIDTLTDIRTTDADLQRGLVVLRRELRKQRRAGTPWQARDRLDVLAPLDLPAWAALAALLDECPVMLANVRPSRDRRAHTLDPADFQFVAERRDVAAIHAFLESLPELLTS